MGDFTYQFGRLSCLIHSTGAMVGYEDWWLTRNRNGSSTMRSLQVLSDLETVRDVIMTRRPDGRPVDAYMRLQIADHTVGTICLRIDLDRMDVLTYGTDIGKMTQSIRIPSGIFSIRTRSIMVNGWMVFNVDRAKGGDQLRSFFSLSENVGDMEIVSGRLKRQLIGTVCDEEVEVPAGTFKATHFFVEESKGARSDFWVAGGDKILLRCLMSNSDRRYELISWTREH